MLLELINISRVYGKDESRVLALKGVNIKVNSGELIAIIGPSGSGKSTLLNILGGIDTQSSGQYLISGKDIITLKDKEVAEIRNSTIGFVLQYFGLMKDYTVFENVQLPLEYARVNKKERKARVMEVLKKFSVEDKVSKLPSEISGGQCQRVAIARAIVNNPKVILADEPTGALDKKMSHSVIDELIKLNKEGKTVIIVTHDESVAKRCNRVIKIEDGEIISDELRGNSNE
ncbi:MAG: ABC transporter ATP-binding protein [Clostridium sp.]